MEELFQIVFEFVFQALFELFADAFVRRLSPAEKTVLKVVLYVVFAALLGYLSTLLLPDPIIRAADAAHQPGNVRLRLVVRLCLRSDALPGAALIRATR